MHESRVFVVGVMLLVTVICGCPGIATKKYSSTVAPTFPASWPLPQLTLPAGCYENPLGASSGVSKFQTTIEKGVIGDNEGLLWIVGFRTDKDFSDIKQHIEACLDMTDFSQFRESNDEGRHVVDWESKDKKTSVQLFYSTRNMVSTPNGFTNYPGYVLEVTVLK